MLFKDLPNIQTLNLGLGNPISFIDLAHMMFKISGWSPKEIVLLKDRPMGVEFRCSNPTEYFKLYKPRISLEMGIARAIDCWKI